MDYKVIWSAFSEEQLDNIFKYYLNKSQSLNVAQKIITKILLSPNRIVQNPYIGKKEEALQNKTIEYRYIISSNYKIIYSINEEDHSIRISDIFDTRQNPDKIERGK